MRKVRPLQHLNFKKIRKQYLRRISVGKQLRRFFESENIVSYVPLALGMNEPEGNYSASEHALGARILDQRTPASVFKLACALNTCDTARQMLDAVYNANLPWLKVSVGSEMAMFLQPSKFWVANTRTVWAHLLVKHHFDYGVADEALKLYRYNDQNSLMTYENWRSIYLAMGKENSIVQLNEIGETEAKHQGVKLGKKPYVWFDAIANELYEVRHGK